MTAAMEGCAEASEGEANGMAGSCGIDTAPTAAAVGVVTEWPDDAAAMASLLAFQLYEEVFACVGRLFGYGCAAFFLGRAGGISL